MNTYPGFTTERKFQSKTAPVADFYNWITYPLRPCRTGWAKPFRADGIVPGRILHAGCATGSQTRSLAYTFPDAEIIGVDFSEGSLAHARKWLEDPMLKNVTFQKADLTQSLERFGTFDMVLSYGVLHHIRDVDRAVQNIRAVLRTPESPFIVFVYGKYGRARIAQLQEALALWQETVPGLTKQEKYAALWEAASSNGTFSGPRGWLKRALVAFSPSWRQVWLSSNADAYLHPSVRYYDLDDILDLCGRNGFRFDRFVCRSGYTNRYPENEDEVLRRFHIARPDELPRRERYSIVDRLTRPFEYEFVCYKTT